MAIYSSSNSMSNSISLEELLIESNTYVDYLNNEYNLFTECVLLEAFSIKGVVDSLIKAIRGFLKWIKEKFKPIIDKIRKKNKNLEKEVEEKIEHVKNAKYNTDAVQDLFANTAKDDDKKEEKKEDKVESKPVTKQTNTSASKPASEPKPAKQTKYRYPTDYKIDDYENFINKFDNVYNYRFDSAEKALKTLIASNGHMSHDNFVKISGIHYEDPNNKISFEPEERTIDLNKYNINSIGDIAMFNEKTIDNILKTIDEGTAKKAKMLSDSVVELEKMNKNLKIDKNEDGDYHASISSNRHINKQNMEKQQNANRAINMIYNNINSLSSFLNGSARCINDCVNQRGRILMVLKAGPKEAYTESASYTINYLESITLV